MHGHTARLLQIPIAPTMFFELGLATDSISSRRLLMFGPKATFALSLRLARSAVKSRKSERGIAAAKNSLRFLGVSEFRVRTGRTSMTAERKRPIIAAALAALIAGPAYAAQYLEPSNAQRSYAAGVVTQGGRTVWLAGMGGTLGSDGRKITDFAGQTRQAFRNIEAALRRAGGSLENLVSMTVMIRNQADGDEFVKIRGEFFKSKFPASMLITAKDFANPDLLVEIQSVGVIGDELK
jgi:enamine deaminase RidA (YjgF/YER057c/UK114 family)